MSCSSPPTPGSDAIERVEDPGREHVAADHREVRLGFVDRRLLDHATYPAKPVAGVVALRAPVRRDVLGCNLEQRQHRRVLALVHRDHRPQELAVVDHDVVAQDDRERFVTDVFARHAHRVAEPERIPLADVVDVGEFVDVLHLGEQVVLA